MSLHGTSEGDGPVPHGIAQLLLVLRHKHTGLRREKNTKSLGELLTLLCAGEHRQCGSPNAWNMRHSRGNMSLLTTCLSDDIPAAVQHGSPNLARLPPSVVRLVGAEHLFV